MIEFKNPPAQNRRGVSQETQDIIDALRSRPGDWALIKKDSTASIATFWNKKPGIEAKSSSIGKKNGKSDIYASWVGEAS